MTLEKLKLKLAHCDSQEKIILHGLLVTIIPVKGKDHDPHISSTNLVRRPNIMYYILLSILANRRIKDIAGLRQPRGNVSVSSKLAATIFFKSCIIPHPYLIPSASYWYCQELSYAMLDVLVGNDCHCCVVLESSG